MSASCARWFTQLWELAQETECLIDLIREIIRCGEGAFADVPIDVASASACASSLRLTRTGFGGTDFCAEANHHFIGGNPMRATGLHIRHPPGDLFVPSMGDGFRRIFGRAF